MEHKTTYDADLARRVAALSSSSARDDTGPGTVSPLRKVPRMAAIGLGLALCAVVAGFMFHKVVAPSRATAGAAAQTGSSLSSPNAAAPLIPPGDTLLGTGALAPEVQLTLQAPSLLDLLALEPGAVIPKDSAPWPGATPLPFPATILSRDLTNQSLRVMAQDRFVLVLPIAEAAISRVALGDTADVEFDALPGRTFVADVVALSPQVMPGRGTVDVSLRLRSSDPQFRANMSARVRLCRCTHSSDHSDNR